MYYTNDYFLAKTEYIDFICGSEFPVAFTLDQVKEDYANMNPVHDPETGETTEYTLNEFIEEFYDYYSKDDLIYMIEREDRHGQGAYNASFFSKKAYDFYSGTGGGVGISTADINRVEMYVLDWFGSKMLFTSPKALEKALEEMAEDDEPEEEDDDE